VICDGHGSNGKTVSNFIAESMHSNFDIIVDALSQVLEEHKVDEAIIL
jgi:serine/threonine protein phosphatase PrpC